MDFSNDRVFLPGFFYLDKPLTLSFLKTDTYFYKY